MNQSKPPLKTLTLTKMNLQTKFPIRESLNELLDTLTAAKASVNARQNVDIL